MSLSNKDLSEWVDKQPTENEMYASFGIVSGWQVGEYHRVTITLDIPIGNIHIGDKAFVMISGKGINGKEAA